jgi:transposase
MKGVSKMNLTQDAKICQVTEKTIVIGVDIASEVHFARAFDWRGVELDKVFSFENSAEGFRSFSEWKSKISEKAKKDHIMIGAEPTGHYWFSLGVYLRDNGIKLVLVNPYHVKQSKELDDNHPGKSDRQDPKTIAKLVIDGRYNEPYIPDGVYADLRVVMNSRWRILRDITAIKNQIQRWLKIYFPEHTTVFGSFDCVSSMAILRIAPLPEDLRALGAVGINAEWRKAKIRAVGLKRATRLYAAANDTIGCTDGSVAARMDLWLLLDDYEAKHKQYNAVMAVVEGLCSQIPEVTELLKIKGVGLVTVAGFLAEVGDLRRFESPRQIQKLAGLALKENSSGKHKGKTSISKRGRAKLRAILFRAAISLAATNSEFREIHHYFTTRAKNPLKKKQSIIAMSCKLIRVFHTIVTKGRVYDPVKLLADIHRNQPDALAA